MWAADGQELFYRNGDAMMAVPTESTEESFVQGIPEVVFQGQYVTLPVGGQDYDVSADGERFLMMKEVQGTSVTARIIVVENWFTELERLVPTAE